MENTTIAVFGSGLIGTFLYGHLQTLADTYVIGRQHWYDSLPETIHIISLTQTIRIAKSDMKFYTNFSDLPIVPTFTILTMKRTGIESALADIPKTTKLVSFSNGINHHPRIEFPGMFPFNVVYSNGAFSQQSSGVLYLPTGTSKLASLLTKSGLSTRTSDNVSAIQAGKLLINLNNALNALSATTLLQEFSVPEWRMAWAACINEALAVFKASGIKVQSPNAFPLWAFVFLLKLPSWIFLIFARFAFKVGPNATSSMYEDVLARRGTEIDFLQGEVVKLGIKCGVHTPVCQRVVDIIKGLNGLSAVDPNLILRGDSIH